MQFSCFSCVTVLVCGKNSCRRLFGIVYIKTSENELFSFFNMIVFSTIIYFVWDRAATCASEGGYRKSLLSQWATTLSRGRLSRHGRRNSCPRASINFDDHRVNRQTLTRAGSSRFSTHERQQCFPNHTSKRRFLQFHHIRLRLYCIQRFSDKSKME